MISYKKQKKYMSILYIINIIYCSTLYAHDTSHIDIIADIPIVCGLENLNSVHFGTIGTKNTKNATENFNVYCNIIPHYHITAKYGYLKHQTYKDVLPNRFTDKIAYDITLKVGNTFIVSKRSLENNPATGISVSGTMIPYKTSAQFILDIKPSSKHRVSGNYYDNITITISGI